MDENNNILDPEQEMPETGPKDAFGFDGMENATPAEQVEITDEMIEAAEDAADETPSEDIDEDVETLAEEALLDGDAEEALAQQAIDEKLTEALDNGQITSEEAEQIRDELIEKLDKPKKSGLVVGLCCGIGALVIALIAALLYILNLNGVLDFKKSSDFKGLSVGKNYSKNVTLIDYQTLTYTDPYVSPTEDEVTEKINEAMKEKHSKNIDVTDKLQNGDVTTIDFDGYIDGKKKDSACATDNELTLGSGKFIPGFESGLVGHKVGDKVTLNLTFPDDYDEESLQGKAVRFEVTIKAAKRTVYDTLTDAIASELSDGKQKTVADYKKAVTDELVASARETADKTIKDDLWAQIVENSKLGTYPQAMYDHFVTSLDAQYSSYYSYYNVSDLEGFLKANNMELKSFVEKQIVYEYAIYQIAYEQKITVGDEDVAALLKQYGYDSKDAMLEAQGMTENELEEYILYNNVTDFLLSKATAK